MPRSPEALSEAEETLSTDLCSACGMCCDGTLFHGVVIQPSDSPKDLAAVGLKLLRKKKRYTLLQPCPAHCGAKGCSVYEHRPERCRAFICRQLKAAMAGEITEALALDRIRIAKEKAAEVKRLLIRLGEKNSRRDLALRYEFVLAHPVDSNQDPAAAGYRRELTAAMQDLEQHLKNYFRIDSP